jgi:DNA-binding MarR family transcriptional regulator
MTTEDSADQIVIPALLRAARGAYSTAIYARLAAAGLEDLPRNGSFVLGGMVNHGIAPEHLIRDLRVSKQAASQLIDTLVVRGYLERQVNPDDRRRMTLELTDRGRAAAAAIQAGVKSVDRELTEILSPDGVAGFRAGLVALIEIRDKFGERA